MPIFSGLTISGGFTYTKEPLPGGDFTLVGTMPGSGGAIQLSYSFSGSTLYGIRNTGPDGSATVYSSYGATLGSQGSTWNTGASGITGASSSYGAGICGISDTVVVIQQRGYFFRSTNTGTNFTNILSTSTLGGQNNFDIPVFDGTYGLCGGYTQLVQSNNSWVSASAVSLGTPYRSMARAAVTKNGGNRFLAAGLGSSQSPSAWYITDNSDNVYSQGSLPSNDNYVACNPTSGLMAISTGSQIYYATYPLTNFTTANVTGLGSTRTGRICVSPQNKIVCPMNTGLWKVSSTGGAPSLISALTDISDVISDGQSYCYAIRSNSSVYRFIAD